MLARVCSAAVLGIDAYLVDVEIDISSGLPTFNTVGLPQGAVREGKERVAAALANAGYALPLRRITVNLAPADVPKQGSAFDLPIALGVLIASEQLPICAHFVSLRINLDVRQVTVERQIRFLQRARPKYRDQPLVQSQLAPDVSLDPGLRHEIHRRLRA